MSRDIPSAIPWQEYEQLVRKRLEDYARRYGQKGITVQITGRRDMEGDGGEYEIDATARFEFMDVDFLVLVECKNHRRPVGRDDVIAFAGKVDALAAHKGMMFSTSGFQRGALDYAEFKGIALIHQIGPRVVVRMRRWSLGSRRTIDAA